MGAPRAPRCPKMEVCLSGLGGLGGVCLLDNVWVHKAECNDRETRVCRVGGSFGDLMRYIIFFGSSVLKDSDMIMPNIIYNVLSM